MMDTILFRSSLLLVLGLLCGASVLRAQNLPVSDNFSLCATVDARANQVQISWVWDGEGEQASGYSIHPDSGNLITINNPNQTEATFSLQKDQTNRYYVLRQDLQGNVFRSNDIRVRLKKTSFLEYMVPGLHQAKSAGALSSNCPGQANARAFNIGQPLLYGFGASMVAWGGVLVAQSKNRKARSNFLFEEDTRYTSEAFADWQDTYELQRTFRDVAVIMTLATVTLHVASLLQSKDKGIQPEIFDPSGSFSLRDAQTNLGLGVLENNPALSLKVTF